MALACGRKAPELCFPLKGEKCYRPFRSPCDILWVILGNRQEAIQVQVQSQGRCSLPGLEAKEKCKVKPLSGTHHESLYEQPGNVLQQTVSLLSAYGKEASRIQKNRETESKKKKRFSPSVNSLGWSTDGAQTRKSESMALH